MARLYCDEQFPREVSEQLRTMGHDVLTVQAAGNANLGIPDKAVLEFAVADNRVVSQKQGSGKVGKLKTPILLLHVYSGSI